MGGGVFDSSSEGSAMESVGSTMTVSAFLKLHSQVSSMYVALKQDIIAGHRNKTYPHSVVPYAGWTGIPIPDKPVILVSYS